MARFAAFDRYLGDRPEVRNVLLTDVRDVLFQGRRSRRRRPGWRSSSRATPWATMPST